MLFKFVQLLFFFHIATSLKTLILIENYSIRETHSIYFSFLQSIPNHQIVTKLADDTTLNLFSYGESLYDNLIILAPSTQEFGGNIKLSTLLEFVDDGGNVIVVGDSDIGDALRDFAAECGVDFDEAKTAVIDHINYDISDTGMHTKIAAASEQIIDNHRIVGKQSKPLLFEGVGMTLDPENPLVNSLVKASSAAYSFFPDEKIIEYPAGIGKKLSLVTALQARNNARVIFSGSLKMFSDRFMRSAVETKSSNIKSEVSGNQKFVESITMWVLKQNGVLRIGNVTHNIKGQKQSPPFYTIGDQIIYSIEIEELVNGKWIPFDGKDVQLEFVRIDPFIRTYLKKQNEKFVAKFKLPDVYGVFQFKVDYKRLGYTYLFSATQVTVRPLEHTQYERFIPCAYPYYASAFSMMVGFFLFSFVFLHYKDPKRD